MSTSDKQWRFLKCVALLIQFANNRGYKMTQSRAYASEAANAADGGHPQSNHLNRLAQDLNLFVDNDYITGDNPAWHVLGAFWKSLDEEARWGGDFDSKDFNHFSFEHNGIQ